ncbi:MAG: periplasmic heavy metal sensor [Pseudomonadota bacterium]
MSRKTLLIVLVVSLAVNLFLVGGVIGGLVVGQRLRPDRPPMTRMNQPVWAAAQVLGPEQARAYRTMLRGEGMEARTVMRQTREARAQAWRTLGAEPFEPATTKQRLAEIRDREAATRGEIDGRIVDFAGGLTPTERRKLATALAEPPRTHKPSRPERAGAR